MILGLDLGTAHLGVVIASHALPLRILDARTLDIDKHDLGPVADWVRAGADANATDGVPPDIVAEMGALYIPADAGPAQARAMAVNHARMDALLSLIYQACPGPVYRVTTIARRSWSSRIVPRHRGGLTNAEASAGLAAHLDPAGRWPLLSDQHRRDACGAVLGYLIGAPQRAYVPGKAGGKRVRCTPATLARRVHDAAMDALVEEAAGRVAVERGAHPIGYSGRR